MFHGNLDHYFSCGASAFNIISAAIGLSGLSRVDSILDFGSGAGRVTRWLRAGYSSANFSVTDIRTNDLAFCVEEFSVSSWASGVSTEELSAPRHYDVIWVGSVITHLPETLSIRLILKLLSWLNPNGVLVLSMHGRFARSNGPKAHNYGVEGRWAEIEQGYEGSVGYGYVDYPFQTDYGISLAKPSWTARLIETMPEFRLVLFSECAWDGHHDVVAIQNRPVADPLAQTIFVP
jgi:SAM-dependent methyltransferase